MREGTNTRFARKLRGSMTDAEQRLWKFLRRRHLGHGRFRRQHPIGPYIADFVCLEPKLVIEVDGGQHGSDVDSAREAWLGGQGFRILRFWNNDVLARTDDVVAVILAEIEKMCVKGEERR